ncbi:MAG TPA: hypothetical protein VH084_23700 [Mycobacterium sp.]|jgi:hypothetical protein|nr:hypothetical protein [Mycobacterium sp.]
MKVAPFDEDAFLMDHPRGMVAFNYPLMGGEPESPENFRYILGRQEGDFSQSRHRHGFKQIRLPMIGDMHLGGYETAQRIATAIGIAAATALYFRAEATEGGLYDSAAVGLTVPVLFLGLAAAVAWIDLLWLRHGEPVAASQPRADQRIAPH